MALQFFFGFWGFCLFGWLFVCLFVLSFVRSFVCFYVYFYVGCWLLVGSGLVTKHVVGSCLIKLDLLGHFDFIYNFGSLWHHHSFPACIDAGIATTSTVRVELFSPGDDTVTVTDPVDPVS